MKLYSVAVGNEEVAQVSEFVLRKAAKVLRVDISALANKSGEVTISPSNFLSLEEEKVQEEAHEERSEEVVIDEEEVIDIGTLVINEESEVVEHIPAEEELKVAPEADYVDELEVEEDVS